MEKSEDDVLNYFMQAEESSRLDLLRKIFNVLPSKDLEKISSIKRKVKKLRKRKAARDSDPQGSKGPRPFFPLAKKGWLSNFTQDQVVALDVEKVLVISPFPTLKKMFDLRAALISVVNYRGKTIFSTKIKMAVGTYYTTPNTEAINGITETSLQGDDCEEPAKAYKRLGKILKGKLIVGLGLEQDFHSFEWIFMRYLRNYSAFDLQWHFYRVDYPKKGRRIEKKLSLRSLVYHYFGEDVHPPYEIHTAEDDAKWTMKIFADIYCKISPPPKKKIGNYSGTNEIKHVNRHRALRQPWRDSFADWRAGDLEYF